MAFKLPPEALSPIKCHYSRVELHHQNSTAPWQVRMFLSEVNEFLPMNFAAVWHHETCNVLFYKDYGSAFYSMPLEMVEMAKSECWEIVRMFL